MKTTHSPSLWRVKSRTLDKVLWFSQMFPHWVALQNSHTLWDRWTNKAPSPSASNTHTHTHTHWCAFSKCVPVGKAIALHLCHCSFLCRWLLMKIWFNDHRGSLKLMACFIYQGFEANAGGPVTSLNSIHWNPLRGQCSLNNMARVGAGQMFSQMEKYR